MFMDPFRASLRQTNTLHHKVYVHILNQLNFYYINFIFVKLGPLPITITDFWRLVWQEKIRTIAMVTNVKEGKTKKCEQYWPAESGSGQSYGPFNVTVVEQHIFADYTIRTIQLVVNKMISYLE